MYAFNIGNKADILRSTRYDWEWSEVVARLKAANVSSITSEQYAHMSKAERNVTKDCGWFIIGEVTTGRKVVMRNALVLDIDYPKENTLPLLEETFAGCRYVIHSTFSSTDENPRYRVVIPLSRSVEADEHSAMLRILHEVIGLELDVATFNFNRIMFLPSVPADVPYFFKEFTGENLIVESLLTRKPNWADLSDAKVRITEVQDPSMKHGIVGAFCAAIPVRKALADFLSDVWKPERDGRYSLAGATTSHGGVIYPNAMGEDAYLVSFHGSDKHAGKSHNAYDLVRLYKFGGGKTSEADMAKFCDGLGIHAADASRAKSTIKGMTDESAKQMLDSTLTYTKDKLDQTISNIMSILKYDPQLAGLFAYDYFTELPMLTREPAWRTGVSMFTQIEEDDMPRMRNYSEMHDFDDLEVRRYVEESYGYTQQKTVQEAMMNAAFRNSFNPVLEYLEGLTWDGVPRLETIFIDCFGVADTPYSREVGKKFFTGAVRRIFIPAAKMDYVPVLVSPQGMQKSKFVRRMAKRWGSDTMHTFDGGKDAYEQLRGVWLVEIAEMNGVHKTSTNSQKAFITKVADRYRAAYARYVRTFKRQCSFIATENDMVFLDDPSDAGRRWWALICDRNRVTIDVGSDQFLERVDDYWAEAVHYYRQGVLPMLSEQVENEAGILRRIHRAESVEAGSLALYLNMPVPRNWDDMTDFERRSYWNGGKAGWSGTQREYVCTLEIARDYYGYGRGEITKARARDITRTMVELGAFTQTGRTRNFGMYGDQLEWKRNS